MRGAERLQGSGAARADARRTFLAAAAALAAFAFSFPISEGAVGGWPLAFIWPALLGLAAWVAPSARVLAIAVFVPSFLAFLALQWWMREITALGMPFLVAYLALWTTGLALLVQRLSARAPRGSTAMRVPFSLSLPIALVAVEFLRGDLVCTGYAWFFAAHPLVEWQLFAQSASLGGGWLVSGLVALVGGALLDLAFARGRRRVVAPLAAGAVLAASLAYGAVRLADRPEAPVRAPVSVLLVQTNLPMSNKLSWAPEEQVEDFLDFANLTLDGAARARRDSARVDLAVWPETMVPGFGLEPESLATLVERRLFPLDRFDLSLRALSRQIEAPLLVGSAAFLGLRVEENRFAWDSQFNSAYLVDGEGRRGRTDKIFLTPFGETMPIISNWDWLEERLLALGADGMTFDLDTAERPERFTVQGEGGEVRVGVPICFEITAPWASRRIAFERGERAAGVLVNISNDGWFGPSDAGRRQHLQVSQLRAIELDTPVVRSANTGISAAIDARGRVLARLPARAGDALRVSVTPSSTVPLAARIGDLVAWAAVAAACGLLFATRSRTG
jgi:apolipoprotein N-acyltransferase